MQLIKILDISRIVLCMKMNLKWFNCSKDYLRDLP